MEAGDGVTEGGLVARRFRLGPVIGMGSSAMVRRGTDERDGGSVAVKVFHGPEQDLRQHHREISALRRLRHAGVVGLRASGEVQGRPFVVTDLVDGPTLGEEIGAGPLDPERVRRIGCGVAAALAHIHAAGLVHRDVKPANVLLGPDGRPRLADFGIARALDSAGETATGIVVGTAAFLAPEQAQGVNVGPPADVYALGLVLLEAITGRREYPGPAAESAAARLHRAPDVPDDLPGGMADVLRAMTAADQAERPTAAQVVRLLAPGRRSSTRRGARHRRPSGRHRAVNPLLAVATGLLAGGAAALALMGPSTDAEADTQIDVPVAVPVPPGAR